MPAMPEDEARLQEWPSSGIGMNPRIGRARGDWSRRRSDAAAPLPAIARTIPSADPLHPGTKPLPPTKPQTPTQEASGSTAGRPGRYFAREEQRLGMNHIPLSVSGRRRSLVGDDEPGQALTTWNPPIPPKH